MPEYSVIFSMAITWVQIFLTFTLITSLLKIKVYWWATLLYSALLVPLYSENPLIMLVIFIVGATAYYFLATRAQLNLTIFCIIIHFFSSQLIASTIHVLFVVITPFAGIYFVRILSLFVYVALLIVIKYKKINIVNLTNNKIILTLSTSMMLIGFAIYVNTPLTSEEFLDVDVLDSIWRTTLQLAVLYMAFTLNKFAKEIEQHEFHRTYTDTLEESLEELVFFKHDSRIIINTLLGYCRLTQWERVEARLLELSDDVRYSINVETINNRLKDNMSYLYGIVLAITARVAANGIRFYVDITATKFELKTVSEMQLIRMVGNLLNNAFDAANASEQKEMALEISNFKDDRVKIVISNSVDSAVDTTKLLEKGYSTKEGHKGYGLYEIQKIVKKQRKAGWNVKFELSSTDDTFTAELLI